MGGSTFRAIALLISALIVQGCGTPGSLQTARDQFFSGQTDAALHTLSVKHVSRRNRLLLLLDRGLIAHTAGHYQQSIDAFLQAVELIDDLDFLSVSEQTTSLITSEWATSYKGEYSERLWVHTFQMMNFLLIGKPESAAVEARQALQIYKEHGASLKNDWFTRAMLAVSFESAGQYDSAHIEYRKLFEAIVDNTSIAPAAWNNARRIGRTDDAARFQQSLSTQPNPAAGELLVFVESGVIAAKLPGDLIVSLDTRISFPFYRDYSYGAPQIIATVDELVQSAEVVDTTLVDIARSALAARGKTLAAKQILRIAAKREISRAVAHKNGDIVGSLVQTLLFVLEQADTRSWETLPAHLALVRIELEPGTHNIELAVRDGGQRSTIVLRNVQINSGQRVFRAARVGSGAPLQVNSEDSLAAALP